MTLNPIDVVILALVFGAMALVVRGMWRGSIRTCDPGSCSGSCASCHQSCVRPQLRLSESQLAELREIDRRAKEARAA